MQVHSIDTKQNKSICSNETHTALHMLSFRDIYKIMQYVYIRGFLHSLYNRKNCIPIFLSYQTKIKIAKE